MSNNRFYERVIREDTQGYSKIVWLCGGFEGQKPFVELPDQIRRELEKSYLTWLAVQPKNVALSKGRSPRAMFLKVLRFSLCTSLSWFAAFSVLDSRIFPTWAKVPLAALTAFSIGYTAGFFSEKQK